jgi:hypothetical protein
MDLCQGPTFSRASPTLVGAQGLQRKDFLTAAGWRPAPAFGAERLKKMVYSNNENGFLIMEGYREAQKQGI